MRNTDPMYGRRKLTTLEEIESSRPTTAYRSVTDLIDSGYTTTDLHIHAAPDKCCHCFALLAPNIQHKKHPRRDGLLCQDCGKKYPHICIHGKRICDVCFVPAGTPMSELPQPAAPDEWQPPTGFGWHDTGDMERLHLYGNRDQFGTISGIKARVAMTIMGCWRWQVGSIVGFEKTLQEAQAAAQSYADAVLA